MTSNTATANIKGRFHTYFKLCIFYSVDFEDVCHFSMIIYNKKLIKELKALNNGNMNCYNFVIIELEFAQRK